MSNYYDLAPDLLTAIMDRLKPLADEAFSRLDGDELTYNYYMKSKNDFLAVLKLSVVSLLQYKGFTISADDLDLRRELTSFLHETSNNIVFSYLRYTGNIRPDDDSNGEGFECYIEMAQYVFREGNYDVIAKEEWHQDEYEWDNWDLNRAVFDVLHSIVCTSTEYHFNSPFALKNHDLKKEMVSLKKSLALNASEEKFDSLIAELIDKLKKYARGTCPEDYELENFWEEICIQVQDQESYDWDLYADEVRDLADTTISSMPTANRLELYLYGSEESDYDLAYDEEATDDENYEAIEGALKSAVYNAIMSEAADYESPALTRALAREYGAYDEDEAEDDSD